MWQLKVDALIVMGDLNAKVGNDTEVWGEILENIER